MLHSNARNMNRARWGPYSMECTLEKVNKHGCSCNKAVLECNIPEPTLRRYLNKNKNYFPLHRGRFRNPLSEEQNFQLIKFIIDINSRIGLTSNQCRKLIFNYVEAHKIEHRFSKD